MKITTVLCVVSAAVVVAMVCSPAPAMAPPDADKSADSKPAAKRPATSPWLPAGDREPGPITRAETVEEALAYSKDEKIVMDDVSDDGQLSTPALYVLLRRAQMLPEGNKTLEEAERPNPKDFWREPKRYRGRLVRLEVRYGGRVEPWTKNITPTRWWGRRDVWMVDVLVEAEKTKPPTYRRMLVVMGHEPPKNLSKRQPLEVVGIFYKLARLREDTQTGDPNKKNEYPVIVAASLFVPQSDKHGFPWLATLMITVVMVMLFVFMRLRRSVARQRAAGRHRYKPMRPDDSAATRLSSSKSDAKAKAGPDVEVNEELLRQVESYKTERKGKNADNA